jgi:hypothetical protein
MIVATVYQRYIYVGMFEGLRRVEAAEAAA